MVRLENYLSSLIKPSHSSTQSLSAFEAKFCKLDFKLATFQEFHSRISIKSNTLPEETKPEDLLKVLVTFLKSCKIVVDSQEFKSLNTQIKRIKFISINQAGIVALLSSWFNSSHGSEDLRTKIMKTIQDFEVLQDSQLTIDERSSLDNLVSSLKTQLKKVPSKASSTQTLEHSHQGISLIFNHYVKQQFLLGKNPTFDLIQRNMEVLNQAKFIKFCKDFEIISETANGINLKQSKKLSKIFKKFSDFNKDMHEHQFVLALQELSSFYINTEYDTKHATNWSSLPNEEKLLKFYEIMGFHDPGIYSKKLKDIGSHFGLDQSSRIPDNDYSKRYKLDLHRSKKIKLDIQQWKLQKIEESKKKDSKKSAERTRIKLTQRAVRAEKLEKKSDCYSSRHASTRKGTGQLVEARALIGIEAKTEEPKPFTLHRLQDLQLEELSKVDKDYNVKHLVPEEDDFLNSYLGKSKPSRGRLAKSMSDSGMGGSSAFRLPQVLKNSDMQLLKLNKQK